MPAGVLTEHRVTHPEITVDGDEAEATWYLQDHVIVPEFDFMLMGAAFYRDRYRKTPTAGRSARRVTTEPTNTTMSLKVSNFKATPGAAIATTT